MYYHHIHSQTLFPSASRISLFRRLLFSSRSSIMHQQTQTQAVYEITHQPDSHSSSSKYELQYESTFLVLWSSSLPIPVLTHHLLRIPYDSNAPFRLSNPGPTSMCHICCSLCTTSICHYSSYAPMNIQHQYSVGTLVAVYLISSVAYPQ